jgi:ABC-type multidrug transport system ATPase subunit
MPEKVIESQELVRIHRSSTGFPRKKKETLAVDGVSFSVPKGELFGVLGPNDAVKTATIKMLITLLTTTSGTANVLGFVKQDPSDVWKSIGPILGGILRSLLSCQRRQNLTCFVDLYGVSLQKRDRRIQEVLDTVGLAEEADIEENHS